MGPCFFFFFTVLGLSRTIYVCILPLPNPDSELKHILGFAEFNKPPAVVTVCIGVKERFKMFFIM